MLQADCLLLHGTVQRTALHFHLVQRLLRMRAQMKHHAQTMATSSRRRKKKYLNLDTAFNCSGVKLEHDSSSPQVASGTLGRAAKEALKAMSASPEPAPARPVEVHCPRAPDPRSETRSRSRTRRGKRSSRRRGSSRPRRTRSRTRSKRRRSRRR